MRRTRGTAVFLIAVLVAANKRPAIQRRTAVALARGAVARHARLVVDAFAVRDGSGPDLDEPQQRG